jgi:hypothetical protein
MYLGMMYRGFLMGGRIPKDYIITKGFGDTDIGWGYGGGKGERVCAGVGTAMVRVNLYLYNNTQEIGLLVVYLNLHYR